MKNLIYDFPFLIFIVFTGEDNVIVIFSETKMSLVWRKRIPALN